MKSKVKSTSKMFGYAELEVKKIYFGAGYFFRTFNVGIQVSRYSAEINLGFFFICLDWYDYGKLDIDWLEELDKEDLVDG